MMIRVLVFLATAFLIFQGAGILLPLDRDVFAKAARTESVSSAQFADQLGVRLEKVEEFRFIREQATKLGIRVWLGGGLATSYGHYVRRDLLREAGSTKHGSMVFDYDLANMTTLSQDLDIIIDGTAEQAAKLEKALIKEFPYSQGNASAWEVRPLKSARPPKEALLGNPNYLNQHTDSTSTGLIEITEPVQGESRVRDLLSFNSSNPAFLQDLTAGKIRYYHSPKHGETHLAKERRNPEILSVIRYLVKLSRHGLEPAVEDFKLLQQAVNRFSPAVDLTHPYVEDWMEKNVKKLVLDSTDLEQLWALLDQLGLRQKLQQVGDPKKVGSVAWWANKQPLLSSPIKKKQSPTQKTAGELGLKIVAHETSNHAAYESIRRSFDGRPNAFISRKGDFKGEHAVNGDGFYVKTGKLGRATGGYTIRFEVLPDAVEGVDFVVVDGAFADISEGTDILITNRNVIRVIQEPDTIAFRQYFTMLLSQEESQEKGLLARLKRKHITKKIQITPEEREWAWGLGQNHQEAIESLLELDPEFGATLVEKEIVKKRPNAKLLKIWFSNERSQRWPRLMDLFIEKKPWSVIELCGTDEIAELWRPQLTKLVTKPEILNQLLFAFDHYVRVEEVNYKVDIIFWEGVLPPEEMLKHHERLIQKESRFGDERLKFRKAAWWLRLRMADYLKAVNWSDAQAAKKAAPILLKMLPYTENEVAAAIDIALSHEFWSRHPKGFKALIERIGMAQEESWNFDPKSLLKGRNRQLSLIFTQPHWRQHGRWPEIVKAYIPQSDRGMLTMLESFFAEGDPLENPALFDILEAFLPEGKNHDEIANMLLEHSQWTRPEVLARTLKLLERLQKAGNCGPVLMNQLKKMVKKQVAG